MICAVCKRPVPANSGGSRAGWCDGVGHADQELADHMRAELVSRGYPDPWRQK